MFGHEHYAEDLEVFGCAGVPINDPLSGKTIGAVDLTCWRKDADALLVALAKTTADQITTNLIGDSTAREFRLMQEYLRACRHTSGIVLALSADVVMMNDCARQVLGQGVAHLQLALLFQEQDTGGACILLLGAEFVIKTRFTAKSNGDHQTHARDTLL